MSADEWTPDEQFSKYCKPKMESIELKIDMLINRLYKDNGSESIQTKLNRLESMAGMIKYMAITVLGLLIWVAKVQITAWMK